MAGSKDPFNPFTEETLRRAETMCSELPQELSIDRRGRSTLYSGALSYLKDPVWEHQPVTVVESDENPWLVILSNKPLDPGCRALLVYRKSMTDDAKLIGELGTSEPGRRAMEDADRFITRFDVVRDR